MLSYFRTRIHVEERLVPEFMPESEVEATINWLIYTTLCDGTLKQVTLATFPSLSLTLTWPSLSRDTKSLRLSVTFSRISIACITLHSLFASKSSTTRLFKFTHLSTSIFHYSSPFKLHFDSSSSSQLLFQLIRLVPRIRTLSHGRSPSSLVRIPLPPS